MLISRPCFINLPSDIIISKFGKISDKSYTLLDVYLQDKHQTPASTDTNPEILNEYIEI